MIPDFNALLTTLVLYIVAIAVTIFAMWITVQSILAGGVLNRLAFIVWMFAIGIWVFILFRGIVNYIREDSTIQLILVVLIALLIILIPSNRGYQVQGGTRK